MGGFGSAVLEFFNNHSYYKTVTMLGIPDRLVEHGKPAELHRECGYDEQGIFETACELMGVDKEKVTANKLELN
jgi:1-deoxy-D-xylulose-5-phosphate synthase